MSKQQEAADILARLRADPELAAWVAKDMPEVFLPPRLDLSDDLGWWYVEGAKAGTGHVLTSDGFLHAFQKLRLEEGSILLEAEPEGWVRE